LSFIVIFCNCSGERTRIDDSGGADTFSGKIIFFGEGELFGLGLTLLKNLIKECSKTKE